MAPVPSDGEPAVPVIQRGPSTPRFGDDKGEASYGLRMALQDYLRAHRRSNEEVKTDLPSVGVITFKQYNNSWSKLLLFVHSKREFTAITDLELMPVHTMAFSLLNFVKETFLAHGRAAYSALLMFSGAQSLRFEALLRTVKCQWNYSVPKYVVYYDVPKLLDHVANLPATSEMKIRTRLILCLRFFALFRGLDLQRTRRTLEQRGDVCFFWAWRKGRPAFERYPLHPMERREFCPQFWIRRYISLTADYERTELLLSVSNPRKPILASTVNFLTARYLRSAGLHNFSAHSTRGAAATALYILAVDPHIGCELGDWRSFDTFRRFYNCVRAMYNPAQALIPAEVGR